MLALVAHFRPDDEALRAAALLHDVGHPPLSHTAEGLAGLDHHTIGARPLRAEPPALRPGRARGPRRGDPRRARRVVALPAERPHRPAPPGPPRPVRAQRPRRRAPRDRPGRPVGPAHPAGGRALHRPRGRRRARGPGPRRGPAAHLAGQRGPGLGGPATGRPAPGQHPVHPRRTGADDGRGPVVRARRLPRHARGRRHDPRRTTPPTGSRPTPPPAPVREGTSRHARSTAPPRWWRGSGSRPPRPSWRPSWPPCARRPPRSTSGGAERRARRPRRRSGPRRPVTPVPPLPSLGPPPPPARPGPAPRAPLGNLFRPVRPAPYAPPRPHGCAPVLPAAPARDLRPPGAASDQRTTPLLGPRA
ncbi:HD domain-containing protein [Streptomyces sp. NPDC057676]|uniref:HD domain-containing protein n=1 Tax=Streptomyces sp. NPDC057676 TaxID=3346205 RepID=UPI0036851F58